MLNIEQVRKKFPQYGNLNDQQFVDALHSQFYSQMPLTQYYKKIGFTSDNAPSANAPSSSLSDYIKDIPNSLLKFTQGAGESVVNLPAEVANIALPSNMQFPLLKSPDQSPAMDAGRITGDIGSFLGGGAAAEGARIGAQEMPIIGGLAKALGSSIGNSVGRIGGAGVYGAAKNPEDRESGALTGALLGGVSEAIPLGLKGLGGAAEYVNPIKYTNKLAESIKNSYNQARQEASAFFNPVTEKYGENKIFSDSLSSEYKNLPSEILNRHYDTGLNRMHEDFMKNPTFNNAHDLQSQLGVEIRAMQPAMDAQTRQAISALSTARDSLKNDMGKFLLDKDPGAAALYNQGSQLFANNVIPYRSNAVINKLASGSQKTIKPAKLYNELTKVVENESAGPQHYLSQALSNLGNKIQKGSLYSELGTVLGGTMLGNHFYPGSVGAGAGALLGKLIGPSLLRASQNPVAQKLVTSSKKGYDHLTKALQASLLGGGGLQ